MNESATDAQRAYYAETAAAYDGMHAMDEHHEALRHVAAYIRALGARTLLDTGCGTGLALQTLESAVPGLEAHGNDPSADLLKVATERNGIPAERLDCVSSEALPYADGQFDVVVETGMLHHVPNPRAVVAEMLRVARLGVFISDSNIYGQEGSSLPARVAKLGLERAGLLRPLLRRMRGGHDWYWSEGDGVAWSYSIFDTQEQVSAACQQVFIIPTGSKRRRTNACPILFATHGLLVGLKDPLSSSTTA